MNDTGAVCAHTHVVLIKHKHPDGTFSDGWECALCTTQFLPVALTDTLQKEVARLKEKLIYESMSVKLAEDRYDVLEAQFNKLIKAIK